MAVVHSVASPRAHLAQSSDPLSVTSFLAFSWAIAAAANRATSEHTQRETHAFIVGPPKKGSLLASHCLLLSTEMRRGTSMGLGPGTGDGEKDRGMLQDKLALLPESALGHLVVAREG